MKKLNNNSVIKPVFGPKLETDTFSRPQYKILEWQVWSCEFKNSLRNITHNLVT